MRPRRSRLTELLAEAKLADRDIEEARARAARDSNNFKSATQALASLVPAGAGLLADAEARKSAEHQRRQEAGRQEDELFAKLNHSEKVAKMKAEQEAAKLKAEQEAKAAEAAAKAKAEEQKRADEMDRDAANYNLKSFAQEDDRARDAARLQLDRDKFDAEERERAAKAKRGGGPPSQKTKDEEELRRLRIEKEKREAAEAAKKAEEEAKGKPLTEGTVGNDITKRARALETATRSIDAVEKKFKAYEDATVLPSMGPIASRARNFIDVMPGLPGIDLMNEEERKQLATEMSNLSAQTWALTGRTDAPSNTEGAESEPIKFTGNETPTEFEAKLGTLREQVKRAREALRQEALGLKFRADDVDAVLPDNDPFADRR